MSLLLEKEMATHSSTLAWKIPWMESPVSYSLWGHKESDTTDQLHFHYVIIGLLGGSDGKESACSLGDMGLIPW